MLIIRDIPTPLTFNETINIARKNKYASAAITKKWKEELGQFFKPYKTPQHPYQNRVFLLFEWFYHRKGQDPDNVAAAAKYIIDALKNTEIIQNDNFNNIQPFLIHTFYAITFMHDGRFENTIQHCDLYITAEKLEYINIINKKIIVKLTK